MVNSKTLNKLGIEPYQVFALVVSTETAFIMSTQIVSFLLKLKKIDATKIEHEPIFPQTNTFQFSGKILSVTVTHHLTQQRPTNQQLLETLKSAN